MQKKDRIEEENLAFHQRVREAFLRFGKEEPDRFRIIDANRSLDEVFQMAIEEIDAKVE
jgi:dTMP kinase